MFFYIAPEEGRQGMAEFLVALTYINEQNTSKIVLVSQTDCPDEYYANPFTGMSNGVDSDDAYVLHFYDLAAKKKHILYKFQKIE